MGRKGAVSLIVGAILLGARFANAGNPTPGPPLNLTELSSTVFLPIDSSLTTYTTDFLFSRYCNGGTLATLAVALDSSRIPDGAHIKKVCFYYNDVNATVEMFSDIWEVRQPLAGGQPAFSIGVAFDPSVSSGAPGYGVTCFDVDVPITYHETSSTTDNLVDYVLAVGFGDSVHTIATDGSITLQRVAVYWTK